MMHVYSRQLRKLKERKRVSSSSEASIIYQVRAVIALKKKGCKAIYIYIFVTMTNDKYQTFKISVIY